MFHLVAHAAKGRLLFSDAREATALWSVLAGHFPELIAATLMPDHVHLLVPGAPGLRLGHAMSTYTRWFEHHRRARRVSLWAAHPAPEFVPDDSHARRTVRYVLLNPCRAGLVSDPLAWPWSTHRDRVGFAAAPIGPVEPHRARFHAYVSGDPAVAIGGTPLPQLQHRAFALDDVAAAAIAVFRVAPEALTTRHPARAAFVRAAFVHGIDDTRALADASGLTRRRVEQLVRHLPLRGSELADPGLTAVVDATGDARFYGWPRLTSAPGWRRYSGRASPLEFRDPWSQPRRTSLSPPWEDEAHP